MRTNATLAVLLLALVTTITSCQVAGGIFKAGMWMGVIVVVLVIVLVLWLLNRMRR
jgi:hypothetical protein